MTLQELFEDMEKVARGNNGCILAENGHIWITKKKDSILLSRNNGMFVIKDNLFIDISKGDV